MLGRPFHFGALLLMLCFGIFLPAHNHGWLRDVQCHHDGGGEHCEEAEALAQAESEGKDLHEHRGNDHHHGHRHTSRCGICLQTASFTVTPFVTAHLPSLHLVGVQALPRAPTPAVVAVHPPYHGRAPPACA